MTEVNNRQANTAAARWINEDNRLQTYKELEPPHTSKILSFEGLRGVASLSVVAYHLPLLHTVPLVSHAYLAVDLFFILSGFVISKSYENRISSPRTVARFMVARAARLMPLLFSSYVLYFALAFCAHLLFDSSAVHPSAVDIFATLSMVYGIGLPQVVVYNFPSWSISTEFLTYLIFAASCYFVPSNSKKIICILAAVSAGGIVIYADYFAHQCGYGAAQCLDNVASPGALARCVAEFFLGAILLNYSQAIRNTPLRDALSSYGAIVASVAALISLLLIPQFRAAAIVVIACFALLIVSVSDDVGPASDFLVSKVPQYLGRLSYSIYLLHVPLLLLFQPVMEKSGSPIARILVTVLYTASLFALSRLTYAQIEMRGRKAFLNSFKRIAL